MAGTAAHKGPAPLPLEVCLPGFSRLTSMLLLPGCPVANQAAHAMPCTSQAWALVTEADTALCWPACRLSPPPARPAGRHPSLSRRAGWFV